MARDRIKTEADRLNVRIFDNVRYVLRPVDRGQAKFPNPNYRNTGQALVGILKNDQTLDQFKQQWINGQIKIASVS